MIQQVILVGHCRADQFMLEQTVRGAVPDAVTIASANQTNQLIALASPASLCLINRQLDGHFGTRDGIELIRQLKSRAAPPATMLISNYADAQQQAVKAGAKQGFGKSQLGDSQTNDLLRQAIR